MCPIEMMALLRPIYADMIANQMILMSIRYGDFAPRSAVGRVVMAIWMVVGFITLAAVLGRWFSILKKGGDN